MLEQVIERGTTDASIAEVLRGGRAEENLGSGSWRFVSKLWALVHYVRPGLVTLGSLALPLVLLFAPSFFFGTLSTLLALFVYDVVLAHRQWHEIFVEQLKGGVEIGQNEHREAGFTSHGSEGPRSVVMRRLPFLQWIRYKYTLRQDYILNSSWRWFRHQLRSFLLDRGFSFARRWHPNHQHFWGDPARELAELCLETSLCLGVDSIGDDNTGRRVATFCYSDWLCPAGTEVPGEVLEVSALELRVDLETRRALVCQLNGKQIGVGSDALCYLYLALSAYHHTALHAYSNWSAIPDHADPHIQRSAMWTLSTNAVALYTGRVCQENPKTMQRALKYNASRGIPPHGAGHLLRELAGHSRFTRFVYRARASLVDIVQAYELEVDVESLYLSSIVHSLDHYMATKSVDPYDLVPSNSKHRGAQLVRLIFSEPLDPILVNTRLWAAQDGWPRALFERLNKVDADLAKCVDIGIAY